MCSTGTLTEFVLSLFNPFYLSNSFSTRYLQNHGPAKLKVSRARLRQVLSALDYLHQQHPPIVHQDVTCTNIFINGQIGEVKLGTIGVTNKLWHYIKRPPEPQFECVAPEILRGELSPAVDIFAFGMVMLEVLTGLHPYAECSTQAEMIELRCNGVYPAALSQVADPESRAVIEHCIAVDPANRPTAAELLSLALFQSNPEDEDQASSTSSTSNTAPTPPARLPAAEKLWQGGPPTI